MEVLAAFAAPEVLKLACEAVFFAWEQYANVQGNQAQCHLLIQRCQDILLEVGKHFNDLSSQEQVSYAQRMAGQLHCLEGACLAVKATIGRLAKKGFTWRLLNQDKIKEELTTAELAVMDAFRAFNVGAHIGGQVLQLEIAAAQKKDQVDLVARLDSVAVSDKKILAALQEDARGIKRIEELVIALEKHVIHIAQSPTRQAGDPTEKFIRSASSALQRMSGIAPDIPHWSVTSLEVTFDPSDEESCIGKGGFGNIFKGDWNGQVVAVKEMYNEDARLLDRANLKIIRQEIMIWSRIAHPHVLPFYCACLEAIRPFMVTRYCENGNALEYLRRIPDASRMRMLHEVSLGMSYLHNQGIIHADLKASNILVGDDGKTLITDFGLSQIQDQVASVASRSKISGTLRWMAPELLEGEPLDRPADVYSFALLGWELYTGIVPYGNIPERAFLRKVVDKQERPDRPENMEDEIWALIQKSWVHEPHQRPLFAFIQTQLRSMLVRGLASPASPRSSIMSSPSISSSWSQFTTSPPETAPPPYHAIDTSASRPVDSPAPTYPSIQEPPSLGSKPDAATTRDAYIKEQAHIRLQQRLAALQVTPQAPNEATLHPPTARAATASPPERGEPVTTPKASARADFPGPKRGMRSNMNVPQVKHKQRRPNKKNYEQWWQNQVQETSITQAIIQAPSESTVPPMLGSPTLPAPLNFGGRKGICAIVLYDYKPSERNELALHENDIIEQIEKADVDWWAGVGPRGDRGLFPSNYVEELGASNSSTLQNDRVLKRPPTPVPVGILAVAEYDYDALETNEISFKEGDHISEIDKVDVGWWSGKNVAGVVGLFPANYVTIVME